MRFGVREICDVVFKPLTAVDIGNQHFDAMQPVLYLDTAKTSTLEGAATTVYAQGGKGNPRLIGWDGEKTITFTIEDALMSAQSFSMLSGAGVVQGAGTTDNTEASQKIYVHRTYDLIVEKIDSKYYARLPQDVRDGVTLIATKEAPIYATILDSAGAQKTFLSAIGEKEIYVGDKDTQATLGNRGVIDCGPTDDLLFKLDYNEPTSGNQNSGLTAGYTDPTAVQAGDTVRIDCYAVYGAGAQELQITADTFAGYYYIEASTLFRDEATGADFPAEFVIPRGKIQSNFTFTMAASGDPSTFTFTIDAFPAYTKFNKTKKVMAALQIIDPKTAHHNYADHTILGHNEYRDNLDSEDYYKDIYSKQIWEQNDSAVQNASEAKIKTAVDAAKALTASSTETEKLAAYRLYTALSDFEEKKALTQIKAIPNYATVLKSIYEGASS